MKSGTCKFGVQCRFDHPPPEEAITKLKAAKGKKRWKEGRQAVGSIKEARRKHG
jgi:hypothetical protein